VRQILIVDDDPYILLSLEFLMKKEGYTVSVARNGSEALEIINNEESELALILLDIMMPDVDGYEICSYVKNNEAYSKIKVVFLSAKTQEQDIKKGYELGASLFITKPFSTRTLMKQIKELLDAQV
jgi:DNA-binding response OmpR family regulator